MENSKTQENSQNVALVKALTEISNRIIKAYDKKEKINVTKV